MQNKSRLIVMRLVKPNALLLCLVPALFAAGCDSSSSPTTPDGGPLVFSGTVTFQGTSTHNLDMFDDGLLTVTLIGLDILLFDTSQGSPSNLVVGFGLGQRDEEGECELTTNILIAENEVRVYRLSRDIYCVSIFDAGAFPEDALLRYQLQAVIST